jgi:signal transduction histidine kinase
MGDPVFFQHSILNNLFSNAMKFSKPSGRIRLEIVEQRNEVFIAIQDWGIGIPKALRRELFSTQGASSREGTAGEKGTGFGMPLVRTALQTMGGRIRVESRAAGEGSGESGTRVELWLPKAIVPKLSSAEEDFRGKRADLSVARTESRVSAG